MPFWLQVFDIHQSEILHWAGVNYIPPREAGLLHYSRQMKTMSHSLGAEKAFMNASRGETATHIAISVIGFLVLRGQVPAQKAAEGRVSICVINCIHPTGYALQKCRNDKTGRGDSNAPGRGIQKYSACHFSQNEIADGKLHKISIFIL